MAQGFSALRHFCWWAAAARGLKPAIILRALRGGAHISVFSSSLARLGVNEYGEVVGRW